MSTPERARHERLVAAARSALHDDAAFDRAWNEGRSWTLDQAVAIRAGLLRSPGPKPAKGVRSGLDFLAMRRHTADGTLCLSTPQHKEMIMTMNPKAGTVPSANSTGAPYVAGNFAPLKSEVTAFDLEVIGRVPEELTGRLPADRAQSDR